MYFFCYLLVCLFVFLFISILSITAGIFEKVLKNKGYDTKKKKQKKNRDMHMIVFGVQVSY